MARPSRPAAWSRANSRTTASGSPTTQYDPRARAPRASGLWAVREPLRIRRLAPFLRVQVGQISDRSPVGVIDDVLEVVVGLPLGRATDDADRRPHLNLPTPRPRQSLGLGDAGGAGFPRLPHVQAH